MAVAFILYFAVRGAVIDRPETAYWNALNVIDLQRALGFFWEPELNAWAGERLFWAQAMNVTYFYLHFPLIILFMIWLYHFRPAKYTLVRDAFLASGAIALVVYWTYPVAPPRELPVLAASFDPDAPTYVLGFVDTMKRHLGYAYDTQTTRPFVNPYAAVPSLHFGWDLLLGMGFVWTAGRSRWGTVAGGVGVVLPVAQVFSVTMTANHFLLDVAAGGVVALMGIPIALALRRWGYPALRRRVVGAVGSFEARSSRAAPRP